MTKVIKIIRILTLSLCLVLCMVPCLAQFNGDRFSSKKENITFAGNARAILHRSARFYRNLAGLKTQMRCHAWGKSSAGNGDLTVTYEVRYKRPMQFARKQVVAVRCRNISGEPPFAVTHVGFGESGGTFLHCAEMSLYCNEKKAVILNESDRLYAEQKAQASVPLSLDGHWGQFGCPLLSMLFEDRASEFLCLEGKVTHRAAAKIDDRLCDILVANGTWCSREIWIERGRTPWVHKFVQRCKWKDGVSVTEVLFRMNSPDCGSHSFEQVVARGYRKVSPDEIEIPKLPVECSVHRTRCKKY